MGPTLSIDYLFTEQDTFQEVGAGSLDLRVQERDVSSFQSGLGAIVRLIDDPDQPGGIFWVPQFEARWIHEYLDDDRSISAVLRGGPQLNVLGDDPVRDSAILGFGLRAFMNRHFNFGLRYDATLSDDLVGHTMQGAFEIRF